MYNAPELELEPPWAPGQQWATMEVGQQWTTASDTQQPVVVAAAAAINYNSPSWLDTNLGQARVDT